MLRRQWFADGYATCLAKHQQIAIYESNGTHITTVPTAGEARKKAA